MKNLKNGLLVIGIVVTSMTLGAMETKKTVLTDNDVRLVNAITNFASPYKSYLVNNLIFDYKLTSNKNLVALLNALKEIKAELCSYEERQKCLKDGEESEKLANKLTKVVLLKFLKQCASQLSLGVGKELLYFASNGSFASEFQNRLMNLDDGEYDEE